MNPQIKSNLIKVNQDNSVESHFSTEIEMMRQKTLGYLKKTAQGAGNPVGNYTTQYSSVTGAVHTSTPRSQY